MKLDVVTATSATLSGVTTISTTAVTGLSSTATLAPGMSVTGTGIPASTTIASITSATAIVLSAAATASGTVSLAFALVEPITLAEAKLYIRVTFTDDDTLIASLITTARQDCERATARTLVTRTYDLTLDRLPRYDAAYEYTQWNQGAIVLPGPPLLSVASIKYYDLSSTLQTLSTTNYLVLTGTPGRVAPAYLQIWPYAQWRPDSAVIRYTAGYGAASDVPEFYKTAIKLLVGHYYNHREAVHESFGTLQELPLGIQAVLANGDYGSYR